MSLLLGDFIKAKHFFTAKVFYSDFSMNGFSCLPKKPYSFSSLQDSSFSKLCTNSVYPLHKKIECLCKKNLSEESWGSVSVSWKSLSLSFRRTNHCQRESLCQKLWEDWRRENGETHTSKRFNREIEFFSFFYRNTAYRLPSDSNGTTTGYLSTIWTVRFRRKNQCLCVKEKKRQRKRGKGNMIGTSFPQYCRSVYV